MAAPACGRSEGSTAPYLGAALGAGPEPKQLRLGDTHSHEESNIFIKQILMCLLSLDQHAKAFRTRFHDKSNTSLCNYGSTICRNEIHNKTPEQLQNRLQDKLQNKLQDKLQSTLLKTKTPEH